MSRKNEIFGEALDWLVTNKGIKGQKGLAWSTGITVNTISRIMTGKVEPSDDTLRKISQKYGFNMQWLRGEDAFNMLAIDAAEAELRKSESKQNEIDPASLANCALSAYMQSIETLNQTISSMEVQHERELADRDARIVELKNTIEDKITIIKAREARIVELERQLSAASSSDLSKYPFGIGAAEERKRQRK